MIAEYKALMDFIYRGQDYRIVQSGNEAPHKDYRHIVRWLIKRHRQATLKQIAGVERQALGRDKAVDHSSIINSIETCDKVLKHQYKSLIKQMQKFYLQLITMSNVPAGINPVKFKDGAIQIHLHIADSEDAENILQIIKSLLNPVKNGT